MKYLLILTALLLATGCSVNLKGEFGKPKLDDCLKDCNKYKEYDTCFKASSLWESELMDLNDENSRMPSPHCTCMRDCLDDDKYECPYEEQHKSQRYKINTPRI